MLHSMPPTPATGNRYVRRLLALLAIPLGSVLAQTAPAPRPSLVVFITIDQMRPDYFTLWERQLQGGLARL